MEGNETIPSHTLLAGKTGGGCEGQRPSGVHFWPEGRDEGGAVEAKAVIAGNLRGEKFSLSGPVLPAPPPGTSAAGVALGAGQCR